MQSGQSLQLRRQLTLVSFIVLVVVLLDLNPPFNRPWSNLYFPVAAYAGIMLRGRAELFAYLLVIF